MPFGLQGTPDTLQSMMGHLIQGLEGFTVAFLDDLVIYIAQLGEHIFNINSTPAFAESRPHRKATKNCQFAMQQSRYLRHIVGHGTIQPELSNLITLMMSISDPYPCFLGSHWLL